jgi:hypothetical protein
MMSPRIAGLITALLVVAACAETGDDTAVTPTQPGADHVIGSAANDGTTAASRPATTDADEMATIRDAPRLAATTDGLELGQAAEVDGMVVALLGHRIESPTDAGDRLAVTMSVINETDSTQTASTTQIGAVSARGAPLALLITGDPGLFGGVMLAGTELRGDVRFDLAGTTGQVTISYTDILGASSATWSVDVDEPDSYSPGPAFQPPGTLDRGATAEMDGRSVTLLSLREAPAALPPPPAGRTYVLVDVAVSTGNAVDVTQNQFQLSTGNGYVAARTMAMLGEDELYGLLPDENLALPAGEETVVQLAFDVADGSIGPYLFAYEDPFPPYTVAAWTVPGRNG